MTDTNQDDTLPTLEEQEADELYGDFQTSDQEGVFVNAVNPHTPVSKIQSVCVMCEEDGWSTFMLTKIPHFKEIIISSFRCNHCGHTDNSVQYGGSFGEKGVRYSLRVTSQDVCWLGCGGGMMVLFCC